MAPGDLSLTARSICLSKALNFHLNLQFWSFCRHVKKIICSFVSPVLGVGQERSRSGQVARILGSCSPDPDPPKESFSVPADFCNVSHVFSFAFVPESLSIGVRLFDQTLGLSLKNEKKEQKEDLGISFRTTLWTLYSTVFVSASCSPKATHV